MRYLLDGLIVRWLTGDGKSAPVLLEMVLSRVVVAL
jgi:hypothetical protein